MFEIRHWPSTTLLNYKMRVWLTLTLVYVLYRRFLVFSYHTTLIKQLSKTHRIVVFTPFHYMVLLNIFCLTLKISKSPYVILPTILKTRILIAPRQIIYQISIVWVKWPGTLFPQYMNQVRMHLLLTRIIKHSDNKLHLNLCQKFRKPESLPKMISQLINQQVLQNYHLQSLQKLLRRSMKFPNSLRKTPN